jgi:Spy/CpxP family protein refolding chaperone
MRTLKNLTVILSAIVIYVGIAGSARAQDVTSGATKIADKQSEVKKPELTKEQQDKIDKLKMDMAKDAISLKNQIEEKRAHLKTISMVDQPDMTAINKTIDEMYVLKSELAKKKAAHIQKVRKILTPEQRLHFDMQHAKKCRGKCGPDAMGNGGPPKGKGCHNMGSDCQQMGQGCRNQSEGNKPYRMECPHKQVLPTGDDKK